MASARGRKHLSPLEEPSQNSPVLCLERAEQALEQGHRARGSSTAFPDMVGRPWDELSGLCFSISRRVFRKGMQVTGKHEKSWHSASVEDILVWG